MPLLGIQSLYSLSYKDQQYQGSTRLRGLPSLPIIRVYPSTYAVILFIYFILFIFIISFILFIFIFSDSI